MSRHRWIIVSLLTALAGCAPGNPGGVVLNVVEPDDQCVLAVGNNARAVGVYDPGSGQGYDATLRVANQLINLSSTGAAGGTSGVPMADPNVMQVTAAEIELRDIRGELIGGFDNPFRVPVGGSLLPSSDGMAFGEGLVDVEVIPPGIAPLLSASVGASVVAEITLFGRTLGDAAVEFPTFVFQIDLPCATAPDAMFGCLQSCPDPAAEEPVCINACRPGQDDMHFSCASPGAPYAPCAAM